MAQKLPRPIEDYLIGKYDNGSCVYLITREAYRNWHQQGITVKHLCFNNNSGEPLVTYSLSKGRKYKAFEFKNIPSEWQPIMSQDNPELTKTLCEYHSPKKSGKFDHIQPDQCIIQDYDTAGLYLVHITDYNKGGHSVPAYVIHPDYGLAETLSKSGCVNGKGVGSQKNYSYLELPQNKRDQFKKLRPELYKHFEDFYAKQVKTEPTPDDYYILKNTNGKFYAVLRSVWFKGAKANVDKKETFIWDNNYSTALGGTYVGINYETEVNWPINNKKFPQLGSEIKQELRELNPERYKEWEDFYVKKYPRFQRLADDKKPATDMWGTPVDDGLPWCGCGTCKSCLERMPLPDPKDDYIFVSSSKSGCVLIKASLNEVAKNKAVPVFDRNIWTLSTVLNGYADSWPKASPWQKEILPSELQAKFEQYYAELEQKKAPEPVLWDRSTLPGNYGQYGFVAIQPKWTDLYEGKPTAWGLVCMEVFDRNPKTIQFYHLASSGAYIVEKAHINSVYTKWAHLTGEQKKRISELNPKVYGDLVHYYWGSGSDHDIDEKVMKANWEDTMAKMQKERRDSGWRHEDYFNFQKPYSVGFDPINKETPSIGKMVIFGTSSGDDKNHDALMQMFTDPKSYGFVTTKARRAGQDFANLRAQEYYKLRDKLFYKEEEPQVKRTLGWWAEQRNLLINNSQTNKQKQHETIIVRGKTKPIIRQQAIRGTAAQGYRVEPAITTGHIAYKQRSVTSKTPAGGCKISISAKRTGNR